MAVKEFNCNKLKRTFWPFTLKDKVDKDGNVVEKGKKIVVRMPQKKVFEAIEEIQDIDEESAGIEEMCIRDSFRTGSQKAAAYFVHIHSRIYQ